MTNNPSFEDVNQLRRNFLNAYHVYWLKHVFLTWQWWTLLLTVILFWVVWWKFLEKTRIHEILNYGLTIGIIAFIFDMVGMNHTAWAYPIRLYWAFIPPLLPFDLTYIPVSFMLVYQRYGESWIKSIIGFAIAAAVFSFGAEPLLNWMGVYQIYKWKYIYSFPIYILMACFVKVVVYTLNRKQNGMINPKH
ncbi:hypothetical protein PP175_04365 [Aneurinibacillus sp. Ricciae_BoGa-3]|uniref:CBO0543 family protein n=1 Tax=Aneurinibacillus sp. Ricciae_BoGa-3 TaxID=3022697 RepID=UPI002341DE18|nr:CBO0543 family protein [Aneurinibacillus sp. Ricciae_BoGa-3]WCK55227.1 hypothetical protein PP175_04365 [Aneurinibacillus sp. Ricciae_BoGa-3]